MKCPMKMLQITFPDPALAAVLHALEPLAPASAMQLFTLEALPALLAAADTDAPLIDKIVEAIKPQAHHAMRREALEAALGGYDSFLDQHGEADPSMRNALGSLSKALRPVFPHDASPLDRLVRRTKHYGPGGGGYLGTRYALRPLGLKVRDRLIADGHILKSLHKTSRKPQ
jgi:hypothetical protein